MVIPVEPAYDPRAEVLESMRSGLSYADIMKKNAGGAAGDKRGAAKDFAKIGKVATDSVFKHTGKHWKQWIPLLQKAGADSWTYQELVAFLKSKHRLTPWWQQEVARGFEIAIGRRKTGQDAKGKYMVTATKSLPCGVRKTWQALESNAGQDAWLKPFAEIAFKPKSQFETRDGFFGEIRTVAKNRRLRLYWQDPLWERHTVVELLLVSRPGEKSILVFNHTGILDTKTQARLRERWREAADRIHELLAKI